MASLLITPIVCQFALVPHGTKVTMLMSHKSQALLIDAIDSAEGVPGGDAGGDDGCDKGGDGGAGGGDGYAGGEIITAD